MLICKFMDSIFARGNYYFFCCTLVCSWSNPVLRDDVSVVRDLVSQFLIPEVERDTVRIQRESSPLIFQCIQGQNVTSHTPNIVRHDQRKYLLAAHTALASQLGSIEKNSTSSSPNNQDNN